MKKIIIYLFIIMIFSCNQSKTKECVVSKKYLTEFSKGTDNNSPPLNPFLIFFIEIENNQVLELNNIALHDFYNTFYREEFSLEEFLCLIYNNNITIDKSFLKRYENRFKSYEVNLNSLTNLQDLRVKYFKSKGNTLILKNNLEENLRVSILYSFFKDQYYICQGDENYFMYKNNDNVSD
ncbi:hypothetical protein E0W68_03045 [Flavobacterium salilacus subsp. salilacus]|uniref:hypothetical protein n=1 Tax=Flavobacterium TaxID=237 RepID=UPI0010755F52|nr:MULTISPECIES: hypothetical protein [Flavobacterium]KAF2519343.1 hypothetical protein E0W68_03045 [Flavobacterium salilacus subsp. salilacus]MBE1614770.1 hypothetical protein [Flavobacterium sp. SaA2.13]